MRTEIKLKYCNVSFDEHFDDSTKTMSYWSTVDFAYGDKATSMELVFSNTMDHRVRDKVRDILIPLLKCSEKDIYLEDCWLMVQGYREEQKHHTARLLGIVAEAEREFEEMIKANK